MGAGALVEAVQPIDLFLQDAMLFGEPNRVQDQLAQDIEQYVVTVVLQMATRFQFAHEPDELGSNRRVRLVVIMNSSDGDGCRFAVALAGQSIAW